MKITAIVNKASELIRQTPSASVDELFLARPASAGDVAALEAYAEVALPSAYTDTMISDVGQAKFVWHASPDVFGSRCKDGYFYLMSPFETREAMQGLRDFADDARQNEYSGEGYQALINDWPFWMPAVQFPSGDCFCMDIRGKGDFPIVFLEHDVMDGGPNIHGLRLADNFEHLIELWSRILFVDIYDWSEVTDGKKIDTSAEIFQLLTQHIISR